jgi:hypothetical protein
MSVAYCPRLELGMRADGSHAACERNGGVTLTHVPATCDRPGVSSQGRALLESCTYVRVGARIALTFGILAFFESGGVWASTPPQQPHKTIVQESAQVRLDELTIKPNGVTLTANQRQRFEVTDAKGESVSVHWTVSGFGCAGSACGTIDDDGNYLAPYSLPQGLVVVLEGVLVSDPNRSVLARIQLAPSASFTAGLTTTQVLSDTTQTPTAPEAEIGSSAQLPPSQETVSSAPVRTDTSTKTGAVVTYQNGQLTIDAENITLAAVLELVAKKTGAVIDVPPGSGLDPIFEHVGPGQANDVLTQLLKGSQFNFVIVSSPQHRSEPEQVLLSLRQPEVPAGVQAPTQPEAAAKQGLPPELLDRLFSRKRQPDSSDEQRPQ